MQSSGKRPGMQSVGAPPPSKRLNGGPTHDTPGDSPDPFEDPDFMEEEEEFYIEEEAPPAAAEIRLGGDDERMRQWSRPPVDPPINQAADDIGKFRVYVVSRKVQHQACRWKTSQLV